MDTSWTFAILPSISAAVGAFIAAGLGAYLSGYLKTKGENLATHEDIEKLKDQVGAVTTTTKEIEAKISSEVWDRQKRWELKREVLFEVMKSVAEIDDVLAGLAAVVHTDQKPHPDRPSFRKWLPAITRFDAAKLLARIVCEPETDLAIQSFATLHSMVASRIAENDKQILTLPAQTEQVRFSQ